MTLLIYTLNTVLTTSYIHKYEIKCCYCSPDDDDDVVEDEKAAAEDDGAAVDAAVEDYDAAAADDDDVFIFYLFKLYVSKYVYLYVCKL